MHPDVAMLRDFYQRPLGQVVRRLLSHRIRSRWRTVSGQMIMGLGYATPYLGMFRREAACVGALMPVGQGALVWPPSGPTLSAMVEEEHLPLPDNSVDKLLAIHCLEVAERARPLLREIWRVLAPEGRLLLIVPNRRSIWARLEATPFGHGHPYSSAQLSRLLGEALLTPVDWGNALHVPPLERRIILRSAPAFERVGARISPAFSGVIIVEAKKEVMAALGTPAAARRLGRLVTLDRGS
jgi:SAM-dependent methyltransferase